MNILWNSNSKAITMFTSATLLPTFPVGALVLHDDVTTNVNRPMVFAPANSRKRVSDIGNVLCSAGFLHECCCQFHPLTQFPERNVVWMSGWQSLLKVQVRLRQRIFWKNVLDDTNLLCALGFLQSKWSPTAKFQDYGGKKKNRFTSPPHLQTFSKWVWTVQCAC